MSSICIYEFDALAANDAGLTAVEGVHLIPAKLFRWLESECVRHAEKGDGAWLRLGQRRGRRVVQVTSFVGVIRAPDGTQIEVLPKVGKVIGGGAGEARKLLLKMLSCLQKFRHVQTANAMILAKHMPLLEIFMLEFLRAVEVIIKRGLRSDYVGIEDNLPAMRGKLLVAPHLRQNLCRADRFFTQYDEFSANRPENRLLRAALWQVLKHSSSQSNQRLARELNFVFADIPASTQAGCDFQRVRLARGMEPYAKALAWARLILDADAPLTGAGAHDAPSLLFPMDAVFEAYVAKNLARQLPPLLTLKLQARSQHMMHHLGKKWFQLRPDLLVRKAGIDLLVLDTKWKLLNGAKANGSDKYGLSQSDFYQLQAYGHSYLDGQGDIVLIYPKTANFTSPLPVFEFPKMMALRLWVVPFCFQTCRLLLPDQVQFDSIRQDKDELRGNQREIGADLNRIST